MSERQAASVLEPPAPATHAPARRLMLQRRCACGGEGGSSASGECEACGARRLGLQRRGTHAGSGAHEAVPASVEQTLGSPGRPLEPVTRSFMESRFERDFGQVRVHDDAGAAQSAADVNAHAYTVGQHVVFGRGQYQPGTDSGQHLLAHELAHTIQQEGLQRAGTAALMDQGPEYRRLEGEADRMADAVMSSLHVDTTSRAHKPTLARAARQLDDGGAAPTSAKEPSVQMGDHNVAPEGAFERKDTAGTTARQESFIVDKLFVPGTKGPNALAVYKAMEGKGLQATLNVDGRTKAVLWQERADTDDLRSRWLQAVGWQSKEADALWNAAGGDSIFPKVGGQSCQMDHVVELQIGGNNTNENIQALDAKQNRDSGGAIKNQVFSLAQAISKERRLSDGRAEQITLRFKTAVAQGTPETLPQTCPAPKNKATCLSVENCARTGGASTKTAAKTAGLVDFEISAAGAAAKLKLDPKFKSTPKAFAPIYGDPINGSAGELMPGLLLNQLHHAAGSGLGIDAKIDTREKTRLPIALEGKNDTVAMKVSPTGQLSFANATPHLQFTYKYLSPGVITKLKTDDAGGLEWAGYITPRVKFLGQLDVSYQKGELKITKGLEPDKLKPPIKGVRLTQADVSMTLAPEFKPEGTLAFEAGPEKKPIATATIKITRNDNGLVAKGVLRVHLPGVDEAKGEVSYQDGAWSGEIVVQSTQIKIPYVESGSVRVRLGEAGVSADGEVGLALPGGNKAQVGLQRSGDKWLFTGTGKFKIPKLDDTEVKVSYDGETLIASGKTGFTFHALKGTLDPLTYVVKKGEEGKVSGTGRLEVNKGRVTGHIDVKLLPTGQFTGGGKVTVRVTDKLTANAGVVVDEHQKVRLSGELRIELIELFKGVQGERTLFDVEQNIPIPGASIPGVGGLMAKVGGGVKIGYGIGPGVLKNVFIAAEFNPLEDNPDLDVGMGGRLEIPAHARFTGYIKGGIALDVTVAEVSGFLTVSASLMLNGGLAAEFKGRYAKHRFTVDAAAEISAALILGLGLDATVRAKAALLGEKSKTWNLKHLDVPTGIDFKLRAPIHYASDEPFKAPSMDTIEWSPPPKIDPSDLLGRIFKAATTSENDKKEGA